MSQSNKTLEDGRCVMWGKDHVLGWFLDVHKNTDCDVDSVISEESTAFTGLTYNDMGNKLQELGIASEEI